MNDLVAHALAGVLAPAGVAGLALVALRRRSRAVAIVLAIGLGYLAGHAAVNGLPPLRLELSLKHGLWWIALVAGALGLLEARRGAPSWPLRALLAFSAPILLLDFMRAHHWGPVEGPLWTAGLGLGLLLALAALEREHAGPLARLRMALAAGLGAGALALSGSATLGQLAGALAACLAVVALGERLRAAHGAQPATPTGATVPFVLVYCGLLFGGRYTSELSPLGAVLLALAPLSPLAVGAVGARAKGIAALLITAALAAGALAYEWSRVPEDPYADYMNSLSTGRRAVEARDPRLGS